MVTYYLIVTDDEPVQWQLDNGLGDRRRSKRLYMHAEDAHRARQVYAPQGRVVAVDMTIRELVPSVRRDDVSPEEWVELQDRRWDALTGGL